MSEAPAANGARYLEIRRALETRIMSGDWRPGFRIPSEYELMEQFACSRMTVNKAVSALAETGLVVRKRRSGSFVAAPKSQQTILAIPDIKAEILASGRPYGFALLGRTLRAATPDDAARLGLGGTPGVIAVALVHRAADLPVAYEDRVINADAVAAARDQAFVDEPPGSWLLTHIPWTDAEHRIRAVAGTARVCSTLGIASGSACLCVERQTWQAGTPITQVRLFYPGESHELIARFSPRS